MRCFIFSGGNRVDPKKITIKPECGDFIIAADSGIYNFSNVCTDSCPNIILGDMDSCNFEEIKSKYKDSEFLKIPCEKNDTDTMHAIDTALDHGFSEIVIIGGIGTRFDHSIANAYSLKYVHDKGKKAFLDDGNNFIFYIENQKVVFSKENVHHKYISIIPISEKLEGVYINGFKYPLNDANVNIEFVYTVSNELICDVGEIIIENGKALIIQSDD